MIRFLLKQTKSHRAAILLLAMLCTVSTAWGAELTKAKVAYIGAGGAVKTATDVPILTEDYLYYLNKKIGSANNETWYYVENELDFSEDVIYLKGTVNIILGDKADLKAANFYGEDATLNIYGTGELTLNSTNYQCIVCTNLNIYGGTISANTENNDGKKRPTIVGDNSVNIYGGKVTVTGECGIQSSIINLGWISPDDYINVSNYGGNVTILPGKEFYYNNTEKVSFDDNISNDDIKGKKLQPVVASIAIDGSNETIYSCLTENSVFNRSDHDVNIKLLTDANFYRSRIIFDNNNSETEGETTHNTKITLNLNGHTVSSTGTTVININQRANVEITDFSDEKNGTICGRSNRATSIENYGTLSVSNIKIINTYPDKDNTNVTKGIFIHDNSKVTIGSDISFRGLRFGIYTYYDNGEPIRTRAMTRTVSNEPAKLYFNALPTFESCIYDIELINDIIMDFSKATAPLALVDGQKKITFNHYNPSPVKLFTKDYKRAFTNPTTGVITNPNDIFEYYYGENYGEIYYAFGEAIFSSKNDTHLSVVTSDASGTISNLFGYLETRADDSNTYLITALKNLENGGTVQLFSDITGATKPYVINKGTAEDPVTLDLNGHTITGDLTVESGCKLMLIDSSNGNGHIKGAISVPVDALQNCLTNWSEKADTIKSTGKIKTDIINNLTWTLTKADGDKIDGNFPLKLIIEGNGTMGAFSWYGAPWYAVHSYITEASLPEGLDQIGVYAFQDCAITSITIPASVRELDYAFYNCKKLANVTFKGNIKEIGVNAFNGCSALKEITLPNSVNKLGQNAFYNSGLTRITIPGSVSKIPMSAFSDCKSLAEVTLSEGLEEIDWAFSGCTSLTEINIPSSVTSIGQNSFYGCTSLKTVRINSTKATCHYLAFSGSTTTSLERIIVPNAATIAKYLEDKYFNSWYGNKIGAEGYCGVDDANDGKNVKWSLMPIADEYINFGSEDDPDERQAYALSITKNTDAENANLAMKENPQSDNWYEDSKTLDGIHSVIKTVTIEEGITNIGENAFKNCIYLETVAVPATVSEIGEYAFYECRKLTKVNIPEGVTSIGDWTFYKCWCLPSIEIPSTVSNIGTCAFSECTSLTNMVIPSKVQTIALGAFDGCNLIKTIQVKATIPPTIENYGNYENSAPFYHCNSLKHIIVPDVEAYSAAYGWNSITEKNNILPLLCADKTMLFAKDASNNYMTWCSDLEYTKPEGCTVYTVSGVSNDVVNVAEVEGDVIPAYTPVLIHRAEGELKDDIKAEYSAVVESVNANGTSYNEIEIYTRDYQETVIASFEGGCVYGNTGAVLNTKNVGRVVNDEISSTYALYGDKFLMIDADEGIPTHRFIMRVYHNTDNVHCSRSMAIGGTDDGTTAIDDITPALSEDEGEWYDLQGRKLGGKPTRKGLYINKGMKIVIK